MLKIGDTIEGRYKLERELGEGGFAKVFAARQEHLDRLVAIKLLNVALARQLDGDQYETRFLHEAKMSAQLSHPNVVTIHEFGFAGPLRQPYIAMELLDGHDLFDELTRGRMDPVRVMKLVLPCLDALATAHRYGIVHKDLKPANLFLAHPGTPQEKLVILDFGVARWNTDESLDLTAAGTWMGTPQYVAPEYATHQIVTPAIDVYQMALIIAEMLTGRLVVDEGTPMACLMVHTGPGVRLPDEVLRSPVGEILRRATQRDHKMRPRDGGELRDLLAQVQPATLHAAFGGGFRPATPAPSADRPPPDLPYAATLDSRELSGLPQRQQTADPDWLERTHDSFELDRRPIPPPSAPPRGEPTESLELDRRPMPKPAPAPAPLRPSASASGGTGPGAFIVAIVAAAVVGGVIFAGLGSVREFLGGSSRDAATQWARIESTPPGASVEIHGVTQGNTPIELPLVGGALKARLVKPGYEPFDIEVHSPGRHAFTLTVADPAKSEP